MPLSNADNPAAEPVVEPAAEPGGVGVTEKFAEPAVVPTPKKSAKATATKVEEPVLARAFTSGNAEVHNLIAERAASDDEAHVAAVDAKLAALGYAI